MSIFNELQLESILFESTSIILSDLGLPDNFLVQLCGYVDYLTASRPAALRSVYLTSGELRVCEKKKTSSGHAVS